MQNLYKQKVCIEDLFLPINMKRKLYVNFSVVPLWFTHSKKQNKTHTYFTSTRCQAVFTSVENSAED